jgi:hypothetical protein
MPGYDGMRQKDASYTGGKILKKLERPKAEPKKPSVPGYNYPSGTPGYVKEAAKAAVARMQPGRLDCGYGKQDVHRSHREPPKTAGKPDVKLDQSYRAGTIRPDRNERVPKETK